MRKILLLLAASLISTTAMSQYESFDQATIGTLPAGWISGVTGLGSPQWSVVADPTAPSKPNVLKQSGSGTYTLTPELLYTGVTNLICACAPVGSRVALAPSSARSRTRANLSRWCAAISEAQ